MEYGINTGIFQKYFPLEKAAAFIAEAGFTQLDYTPPVHEEDWYAQMKTATEIFRANGLTVHQTHIPFNRYGRYGEKHALCVERCIEASAYMGVKYMVAHGDEFDFDALPFSPEAALDYNHRYFLPTVEKAEKIGCKVAFETVFEDSPVRRRFTSKKDELMALIRSFERESVVCCWDFGHANVSFRKEAPAIVKEFGSLIECVHLHDNAGNDSHQMPMTGDINWKATMDAFRAIPYTGVLSIEYAHGSLPECLASSYIALSYQAIKYVWEH